MAYTTINDPTDYFNTKLYTGNGGTLVNTGVGFQPDLVWVKSRTQANSHVWFDVIRTFAGGKEIQSNNTGTEGQSDSAGYGYISAVSSDGFTAQAGTTAGDYTNVSSQNYVAWNWLAGGTASSNTDGSITSSVSANQDAGFSIVSYTGTGANATVGHGLGVAPKVIFVKSRSNAENWQVYHGAISGMSGGYITLNNTDGFLTNITTIWNGNPDSDIFGVGTYSGSNQNTYTYIAYCFAEKQGYSKFGSYTGNGSTDGAFVYTGFKPAFLIVKRYDSTNNWYMYNNKVNPFNETDRPLKADTSENESTIFGGNELDFLSNGFKLRDTINGANGSGASYIYMAFAEHPFVSSTGTPTTAR